MSLHLTLQEISLNSWLKGVPMGYIIMMNPFILEGNVTGSFSQCYAIINQAFVKVE